jgi:hypothetical protein
MHIAQREFSPEILDRITKTVRECAELTRYALAKQVCAWVGWFDAAGRAKESSCRALLVKLERRGLIEWPGARVVNFAEASPGEAAAPQQWLQIKAKLAALGKVELVAVNGYRALSRVWRAMLREHHPLSDGPLCGAQLRYLIRSERGWLGGLSFSSAAWRLKERDKWIGWSEATRKARLDRVMQNSRFLILPTVRVPHLASHVLGLAMRQLAPDWQDDPRLHPVGGGTPDRRIDPLRRPGCRPPVRASASPGRPGLGAAGARLLPLAHRRGEPHGGVASRP